MGSTKTITELRRMHGLSQENLAKCIGCGQPILCRWETGAAKVPSERVEQLCKFFGIKTKELQLLKREPRPKVPKT